MEEITREEANALSKKMHAICEQIPSGLSHLSDALIFASLDITAFGNHGIRTKYFPQALAFAKSIPEFSNLDGADFTHWMLNDQEHLEYWPGY
ncbi:hypothetical protein ACVWYN_002719 [Pedobacter sp. UYP24]